MSIDFSFLDTPDDQDVEKKVRWSYLTGSRTNAICKAAALLDCTHYEAESWAVQNEILPGPVRRKPPRVRV